MSETTKRCRFWLGKGPCPKCGLLALGAVAAEEEEGERPGEC